MPLYEYAQARTIELNGDIHAREYRRQWYSLRALDRLESAVKNARNHLTPRQVSAASR